VFGEGPPDIVFCPEWFNNIDVWWEEPRIERFLNRLASFGRVIVFDKRGTGVSDPVPLDQAPILESWMDDIVAVMRTVGSGHAVLFGHGGGAQVCALFAATHPDHTDGLILSNAWTSLTDGDYVTKLEEFRLRHPDYFVRTVIDNAEFYMRHRADERDRVIDGTEQFVRKFMPSAADDERLVTWLTRYARLSAAPMQANRLQDLTLELDIGDVLPAIQAPTLVLARADHYLGVSRSRELAGRISNAKLVELPGADHLFFLGDTTAMLDEVETFVTGTRREPESDRVLATVLFTDIVSSTDRAAAMGDRKWSEVLALHDGLIDRALERFGGRRVKHTGDGILATFDGPGRAVRCAREIAREVRGLGIEIRAGLHTGEIELRDEDVAGMAVNIAKRVNDLAGPNEVFVSRTVRDIVVGSQLTFDDRGTHELKGVPDEWRIYAVEPGTV